jgi:hypothetical protein
MDDRPPLSKDTVADALLEDDICYRNDTPGSVEENDSSSLTSTPLFPDPSPLGEGNHMLEPLAEEDGLVCIREQALDWQSLFAFLLCGATVRMTSSTTGHFERLLSGRPLSTVNERMLCHVSVRYRVPLCLSCVVHYMPGLK